MSALVAECVSVVLLAMVLLAAVIRPLRLAGGRGCGARGGDL
ncbi:hypothetical protein [Mycobacterium kiyosense]